LIADRLLGRTRTVAIGATLMALGHFLMAFDVSFLIALACLLAGVGCFKGNIASQVGELYAADDLRRADAFQLYFIGINVAVIVAPLICGTLGQKVAWHWGFGAAGVGMLAGLAVYLAGRKWLPADAVAERGARTPAPRLAVGEGKKIVVLVALLPILAVSAVGNQQIFNAYLIWGDANYDLVFFGKSMPVTWLISLDAIISTTTLIGSLAFWRLYAARFREPDEITKVTIGTFISAGAPLMLAIASWHAAASGQKIGLGWGLAFHIINDIGFANVFPVGIALYSRASPRAVAGMMIGVYYLHLFAANMMVGWLGGLVERMTATNFWLLHAGLLAGATLGLLVCRILFGSILAPPISAEAVSPN
jgi:POT family proton-dependent oligopeptide transporter